MNQKNVFSENPIAVSNVNSKSISWSAIIAGAVTVLAILLVLNLIGVSIGLFSFNPASSDNPANGLGTGSFIWWVITNIIALFLGGFVAGRVGTAITKGSAMIHGFVTWALYALASVWLLTSAIGSIFSGLGSLVGGIAKGATNITSTVIENTNLPLVDQLGVGDKIDFSEIKAEAKQLLRDTEKDALKPSNLEGKAEDVAESAENKGERAAKNPNEAEGDIDSFIERLNSEGREVMDAADKDALVNIFKNRTDMSEAEARQTVDNYAAKYEKLRAEAKQKWENVKVETKETAEKVTNTAGSISIWAAIALIIGAAAAVFGGVAGFRNRFTDVTIVK